jgi:hypothetical protein
MKTKFNLKNTVTHFGLLAGVCLGSAVFSPAHAATAVTLQSLIDTQGSIITGDKKFDNFHYVGDSFAPTAAQINVLGEVMGGLNGIEFDSYWHANPLAVPTQANITYDVTVLDPTLFISDIHLDADPSVIGGNGQSLVKLSASDATHGTVLPGNHLLEVYQLVPGTPPVQNAFANTTGLFKKLTVETTFLQSADSATTTASVLHVQESFSQAVPEPSTYAMAIVGLGMVGFSLRRNRKQQG